MAAGLARTLFAAGTIFALAYLANASVRKETGAAGFAWAARKGVSKIKPDETATLTIGVWAGGGTNAGKGNTGIIGANFGETNGGLIKLDRSIDVRPFG